jgi:ABC-2 type transport system permease protein
MKTMLTLLRREWLEHRTALLGTQLAALGVLVLAAMLAVMLGSAQIETTTSSSDGTHSTTESREGTLADETLHRISPYLEQPGRLKAGAALIRDGIAKPFQALLLFVLVFYLLGTLFDERSDRSVLFWKSMPVSDTQTVASKVLFAMLGAPVVAIVVILLAQLFAFTLASIAMAKTDLSAWTLWSHSGLLYGVADLVVGYLIQGLWSLPVYAWLLFVSAAVPRVPFVWAIATPFVPIVLEGVIFNTATLYAGIKNHLTFRALVWPPELVDANAHLATDVGDSIALLATTDMWVGLGVTALLLAATVYYRRRNNET